MNDNDFIDTYKIAHDLVTEAVEAHKDSWLLIEAQQKHIDGEKPFSQAKLKEKAMSWASNWNYGKSKAKLEKITAENIAMASNAIALSYVTFKPYSKDDDEVLSFLENREEASIYSTALVSALAQTLLRESRISDWFNQIEYPATAFGFCALVDKENDWLLEPVHPLNIAFRPQSKADDIPCWITFSKITANELWRKWGKINKSIQEIECGNSSMTANKVAGDGWSMKAIEGILYKAFKRTGEYKNVESWATVTNMFSENPSTIIQNTNDISIAKIYYKELDGSLTEVYIPWANDFNRVGGASVTQTNEIAFENILYKKNKKEKNQGAHISLIRDSGFSVTGYIENIRGLAKYAVEDSIRYNRIRNNINNKGILSGSPMFEKANTGVGDAFKLTVSQGFVILPTTHNLIERQPSYNIGEQINILRFEEQEFQRETQQYDASIVGRLTSRPNRGEVQRVTEEVETINASKNNIKLRDYSVALFRMLKAIANKSLHPADPGAEGQERFFGYALKYLSRIAKTKEDIRKIVNAVDSFIIDPVVNDENVITLAIQMAETPFARNRFRRMLLVSRGMPIEEVNIAVPIIIDKFTMLQDDRVAAIENDMFWTTNEVIFSGSDDDVIHCESHILKTQNVIKGVMEGRLGPVDAFKWISNAIPHIGLHVDMLGGDPALNSKAQEYMDIIKQMQQAINQIRAAAEQQIKADQEMANQPPPLDPKTEADIIRDNTKAMSDTERKNWIAQQRTAQRERQIELSHEQKLKEIELKNQ
jgi:hypothetical protein